MPHTCDTITSITPLSFVDDRVSIRKRTSQGSHRNIENWLKGAPQPTYAIEPALSTTSTSTFSASFIDDGADMLVPSKIAPGFGEIDPKFYDKGKKSEDRKKYLWGEEMDKAVGGDMWRSLSKMRTLANVQVQDHADETGKTQRGDKQISHVREVDNESRVKIMVPSTWGTFLIKGEDGRVIMIDKEGEYDSGLPEQRMAWEKASKARKDHVSRNKDDKKEHSKRGKEKEHSKARTSGSGTRRSTGKHKHYNPRTSSPRRSHFPTLEASTPEHNGPIPSPTKFFMTGVASGWGSSLPSPMKSPPLPATSHPSPPGAWPSPLPSPVKESPFPEPLATSPVGSLIAPVAGSQDSWKDDQWKLSASPVNGLFVEESHLPSMIPSSRQSHAASTDSWQEEASWVKQPDTQPTEVRSAHSTRSQPASPALSAAESRTSKDPDAEKSPTYTSQKSAASRASTIAPYSWRREVEDQSINSTVGSGASHAPSAAGSRNAWNEIGEPWKQDADNQSVRTLSTYRAPTVEDAPDTPQEEVQEWTTNWGAGGDDNKGSDKDSNNDWGKTWSGKGSARLSETGGSTSLTAGEKGSASGWTGSQHGSHGSRRSRKDKSGFDEDNETWLNSEVGGMKYREAEWRRNGSWRDV